jgi:hypothetical protein
VETWQKKSVFWRTVRRPGRLILLLVGLGAALIFSLILDWFWPAVALLAVSLIGFIVSIAMELARPETVNKRIYEELTGLEGLGYRFKTKLQNLVRLFDNFLRRSTDLDDEMIRDARREALTASLLLADRLRRVAVVERAARDAARAGVDSERAEKIVADAVAEVEEFTRHLEGLISAAAEAALLSREEAAGLIEQRARAMHDWREALAAARREMDESGF